MSERHRGGGERTPVNERRDFSWAQTEGGGADRAPADAEDLVAILDLAVEKYPRFLPGEWEEVGGMGQLAEVYDRLLGRTLVRKRPRTHRRDPAGFRAFVHEAQVTAQLNHPSIVPLLDLRHDGDGYYYLMPRVAGTNLHEVLARLAAREREATQRYGLSRLLQAFRTVCGAVAHAHQRGVVHRDLKPDQIVFGEHGEVLVLDWGLAARVGGRPMPIAASPGDALSSAGSIRSGQTVLFGVHGAPRYLAPERLEPGRIRAATTQDVYALGAVLYHVLAWRPPVSAIGADEPPEAYWERIRGQIVDLARPSEFGVWQQRFDPIWDAITMRCLAVDPEDRYADAGALFRKVDDALDELVDLERRRERATEAVAVGNASARELDGQQRKLVEARGRRRALQDRVPPHAPLEARRDLWDAEDREEELALAVADRFAAAERAYHLALSHDGGNREARERLADLYEDRLREAEREGDAPGAAYYLSRLREYDDGRRLKLRARAGTLTIEGRPRGAAARLAPLVEVDRRLVPASWTELGQTPVGPRALEQGRYQLEIRADGRATARYALRIEADDELRLWPTLPLRADVPDGFAYVPAGPCLVGGDPALPEAGPRRRVDVADFAIGVFPVTMGQYRAFIATLPREEAERRIPREPVDDVPIWRWEDGQWTIPARDPHGDPMGPETPALLVRAEDAEAYCAWLGARMERTCRLPTRDEWEYAARSGDGRFFPWGNRWEPHYCWGAERQLDRPKAIPAAVGRVAQDRSVAGVRDLAGNVADWLADGFTGDQTQRHVGGGVWFSYERTARLARRVGYLASDRSAGLAFRPLADLVGPKR